MTRSFAKNTATAIALIAAVAGGYTYRGRAIAASSAPAEAAPQEAATSTGVGTAGAAVPTTAPTTALPDFSAIVARFGPAVVNVSTTGTAKTALSGSPNGQLGPDDPFHDFFRRFGPPEQRGDVITRGLGSGFIVSPDGIVLTNAHVVATANEVTVKLTDKREFAAKVIGADKTSDVAVLKIDAKDLPTVKIGDPSRARVGGWVLAIGSPFGFENSATAGILSARARSLPDGNYVPFLQTDVAVNPGNSGGPLFDTDGNVIGINSQIYSQSGGYMGLSFAIPIDVAMNVEHQLVTRGKVVRGKLGVTIQDVNQALAQSFGLPKPAGALVSSVEKGGPAAKAGIQAGDVILRLDGSDVTGASDLPARIARLQPGSHAKLDVWRDHHQRTIEVRLSEVSDTTVAAGTEQGGAAGGRLGLAVRPLTPEEQQQSGIAGGLVVEDARGPAARAGIQPGDVVRALNGTEVTNVEQLRGLVSKAGKHVALLVERGDAQIFVPVDLG